MIYSTLVPVDAKVHHFVSRPDPLTIKLRGNDALGLRTTVLIERPASSPHTIAKDRYPARPIDINCFPIPFNRTVLNRVLSGTRIINPTINTITGLLSPVLHSTLSHDIGSVETAIVGHAVQPFFGRWTNENPHFCSV